MWAWPSSRARGRADFEANPFYMLQISNDFKQIDGGRIPMRTKHLVKALYVDLGMRSQLRKTDRGIDVITQ